MLGAGSLWQNYSLLFICSLTGKKAGVDYYDIFLVFICKNKPHQHDAFSECDQCFQST
jgi:hypothetical protein